MNQEESEHNEVDGMKKGVDSTGEVTHVVAAFVPLCRRRFNRFTGTFFREQVIFHSRC